jgi:RNA-directed DNA polymerase
MSLQTPETVGKLQRVLHAKAKGDPAYAFYSLYDKVWREDVLRYAWQRCRANGGAAGVDGQRFSDIEKAGLKEWLDRLAKELREKTYQPAAVKRVWIPKANGQLRPLGLPTIRDRVAQMAAVIVMEPIYEADMPAEQYGYRPGRSAHDAIREIHGWLNRGHREVVDADLSGYFDTIPHHELMKSMARRIRDGALLQLIRKWLEMAVEETADKGGKTRTTVNKDSGRGTPQGAPISPLLSNLYMRRFVLGWKQRGLEGRYQSRLVVYADDFVILCRHSAHEARQQMSHLMEGLRLKVNEEKTRVCRVPEESLEFLGYTLGRCYSTKNGKAYLGTKPSCKRVQRICEEISEMTRRENYYKTVEEMVGALNRKLRGWGNYFCLGAVSRSYRAVDNHARQRLRQWLNGKHLSRGNRPVRHAPVHLHEGLGLFRLEKSTSSFPWAKAC